jgi:hypothetical protein
MVMKVADNAKSPTKGKVLRQGLYNDMMLGFQDKLLCKLNLVITSAGYCKKHETSHVTVMAMLNFYLRCVLSSHCVVCELLICQRYTSSRHAVHNLFGFLRLLLLVHRSHSHNYLDTNPNALVYLSRQQVPFEYAQSHKTRVIEVRMVPELL